MEFSWALTCHTEVITQIRKTGNNEKMKGGGKRVEERNASLLRKEEKMYRKT